MAESGGHGGGVGGALKKFFVALGLQADAASFASAQAAVDALEHGLEKLVDVAKEAIEAFAENIVQTAEYAESLQVASATTGLTTQALQELNYAARVSGVGVETMQMGFVHLARTMNEAKNGNTEAALGFGRLGVKIYDAHGKLRDLNAVADDVADGLAKLPPGAARVGASMDVMGRSGSQMLPILGKGSEALKQLRRDASELGVTFSPEELESAGSFVRTMRQLEQAGDGLKRLFALPFLQALEPIMEQTIEWVRANRDLIKSKVTESARNLIVAAKLLLKVLQGIGVTMRFLIENWRLLVVGLVSIRAAVLLNTIAVEGLSLAWIKTAALSVAAAVRSAAAWAAAALPIVIIAALVAALFLVFNDFYHFLKGDRSLFGVVIAQMVEGIEKLIAKSPLLQAMVSKGFGWIADHGVEIVLTFNRWKAAFEAFVDAVVSGLARIGQAVKATAGFLGATAKDVSFGNVILGALGPAGSLIGGLGNLFGGGASPAASAAAAGGGGGTTVIAPQTNNINVHGGPQHSAGQLAGSVRKEIEDHHTQKMREAAAAATGN